MKNYKQFVNEGVRESVNILRNVQAFYKNVNPLFMTVCTVLMRDNKSEVEEDTKRLGLNNDVVEEVFKYKRNIDYMVEHLQEHYGNNMKVLELPEVETTDSRFTTGKWVVYQAHIKLYDVPTKFGIMCHTYGDNLKVEYLHNNYWAASGFYRQYKTPETLINSITTFFDEYGKMLDDPKNYFKDFL